MRHQCRNILVPAARACSEISEAELLVVASEVDNCQMSPTQWVPDPSLWKQQWGCLDPEWSKMKIYSVFLLFGFFLHTQASFSERHCVMEWPQWEAFTRGQDHLHHTEVKPTSSRSSRLHSRTFLENKSSTVPHVKCVLGERAFLEVLVGLPKYLPLCEMGPENQLAVQAGCAFVKHLCSKLCFLVFFNVLLVIFPWEFTSQMWHNPRYFVFF